MFRPGQFGLGPTRAFVILCYFEFRFYFSYINVGSDWVYSGSGHLILGLCSGMGRVITHSVHFNLFGLVLPDLDRGYDTQKKLADLCEHRMPFIWLAAVCLPVPAH